MQQMSFSFDEIPAVDAEHFPKNPGVLDELKPFHLPAKRDWQKRGVYFVRGSWGDVIKIGHAKNVSLRMRELRVGNPGLELVGHIRTKHDAVFERMLHIVFAPYRLLGEWFRVKDDVWRLLRAVNDGTFQAIRFFTAVWPLLAPYRPGYSPLLLAVELGLAEYVPDNPPTPATLPGFYRMIYCDP